jgi:hypothetical protein
MTLRALCQSFEGYLYRCSRVLLGPPRVKDAGSRMGRKWARRSWVSLFVVCACGIAAMWCASSIETTRPTGPPTAPEDYLGVANVAKEFHLLPNQIAVYPIAAVNGALWEWTNVNCELYLICSGRTQGVCSVGMGTSSGRLDHLWLRYRLRTTVAVCSLMVADTRLAFLTCKGAPSAVGASEIVMPEWQPSVRRNYDRRIRLWTKEIIYVEGNNEPLVYPGMSIHEFCDKNNGDFLVVVASLQG